MEVIDSKVVRLEDSNPDQEFRKQAHSPVNR